MTVVVAVAAFLAVVAAAGVLVPFVRPRAGTLERLADPLDDERETLLRTLRDLEAERAFGELPESAYRELRAETERRAVAVLRAIQARDGAAGSGLAEIRRAAGTRRSANGNGNGATTAVGAVDELAGTPGSRRTRALAPLVVGAVALAVVVPLLIASVARRDAGQPITGTIATPSASDPLAFFEQRVRDHPNDLAARLDLGARYLAAGDVRDGIAQYLVALRLDPRNAEAHASLGLLLFRAGRPADGLRAIDDALAVDPTYPEAIFDRGVVLLEGLHRPNDAAASFEEYLRLAPYGAHRADASVLLARAKREIASD